MEVAVVARRSHAAPATELDDLFRFVLHARGVVLRLIDADTPAFAPRVHAARGHLTTDLHHVILHALALKQRSDHVAGISLGDGREAEFDPRIIFHHTPPVEPHLAVAHELKHAVDDGRRDAVFLFIAEAPEVDERRRGDVEHAARPLRHFHRAIEDGHEPIVHLHLLVAVHARQDRSLIEGVQRGIEGLQLGSDLVRQRPLGRAVLDVVDGMENRPLLFVKLAFAAAARGYDCRHKQHAQGRDRATGRLSFRPGAGHVVLFHHLINVWGAKIDPGRGLSACRSSANAKMEKTALAEVLQTSKWGKGRLQNFCKRQNGEKGSCRSSANAKMEKSVLAEVLQGHHEKRRKALTGWTSAKTFLDS